jgi:hypothetical protein
MKKLVFLLVLLQVLVLPAAAAEPTAECTLCAGITGTDGADVPVLARVSEAELAAFAPTRPGSLTVVVSYAIDTTKDPLLDIEEHTKTIIDWARAHGPLDGLGISVTGGDPAMAAFAIKRLAVTAQGLNVAKRIVGEPNADALTYLDAVLTKDVEQTAVWLAERDPSKKIYALVDVTAPNALFDLASALAKGATRAYATTVGDPSTSLGMTQGTLGMTQGLAAFNRTMTSDWAFDSTAKTTVLDAKGNSVSMPVLTFVRGEDLRTLLIPRGETGTASILSLPGDRYTKPRRVDAGGERDVTDTARRGGSLLVGTPVPAQPYALLVDYTEKPDANVTKETINIATERGITVEEIIRNHQAYDAYQESIQPRYIARNTTKLRFEIGGGAEALEAAIEGDYFSDPEGRADWVWQDFFINGVKWKYGRIPELPLIQPEKVTQLPLDLHLSNEYRYELVRPADMLGFRTYEVRFSPPPNAPENLPLYRGTVWIDAKTWARVRIVMVQMNLTGEVLSNEERVDFAAFARGTSTPLTAAQVAAADPKSLVWLPYEVGAQQVISAAGRASVVQRETTFANFRVDPPEYATLLAEASASDARMVRETEKGLRYLEKTGSGERVVKEGFDTAQLFMVGGIHHDAGLDYPVVPLGGIDYFNFDLFGKGIQTNVFFAGVIVAANATHPNVGNTRTNVGVDFFGIAVPFTNTMHRGGEERLEENVKALPIGINLRAGHPVFQFGKIDLNLGIQHLTYQRAENTAPGFQVPADTFVLSPSLNAQYSRRGYSISGFYDYNRRTTWEPWGNLAEYDPNQKSFTRFGGSIGKSFFLPKFQRIGIDVNYLDGSRLDRFSKYELGFFGAQRVHGVESGTVRAERAILGHLSYGFVFSQQFRLEAFYDHALIDDATAGYEREPFQGVGIAGQTVGPYGTLLRLDIGKTIGRNAQDGFVANVVFLKLF